MPAAAPIQNNFNSGEFSPLMRGRVDFERYKSALKVCTNQFAFLQGGVTRRPGFYFVDEGKDSTKQHRLVKFKYSTISAFAIEFGDQYIRFKKNRAPVYDLTLTITGITQAAVGVVTYTGTDPVNGDHVDVSGVVGMTQVNGRRFKVSNVNAGANTFELEDVTGTDVDTTTFTAWSSGGSAKRVYEIASTYLEADLFQLKFTQSADVLYIWHPDYPERKLSRVSDTNWTLLDTVYLDGPYMVENSTTTTLTPSAATGDGITVTAGPLGAITGAADNGAGLIRITDAGHGYSDGILLRITGVTGTTEANGNWIIRKITNNTYDLVGSAFVNAYAAGGATRPALFVATDVGRLVRMKQGAVWGYALIVGFTDESVVTADVVNTLTSAAAKLVWRLGMYSETTGYPAHGTFYGDRLYRGGAAFIPERFDGSRVGDYDNMTPSDPGDSTVTDSHAVSFRLTSNDVQTIRWMIGTSNGICIGTFEGEWLVTPSTTNEAITPTNISARQSTGWGSADIQAVRAGSAVLFVESGARRIREMNYLYYENVLQSLDTTVLAEHITKGFYDPALGADSVISTIESSGVVEIDYQKKKIPMLWAPRKDGVLLSQCYSKDDKVMGWLRHPLGGWADVNHDDHAACESLCVIPSSDASYDELWIVVKRYINGRTVRYNEFLTDIWEQGNDQFNAFFVDSGLTYIGALTTTITGLFHLAGETVQVLVDGSTHPDVVVSATGTITLQREGSVVHVGYAYNSDGQMNRIEAGSATGTAQGKLQRAHRIIWRLHDTLGLKTGPSFSKLTEVIFRTASDPMDLPVPLFTGDKPVGWEGGSSTEMEPCWRFSSPLPGTILAIMPQLHTQDAT